MLLSLHRNFVKTHFNVYKTSCSDGGIGRHEGLKIPWPLRLCGFKSHSEYLSKGLRFVKSFAFFNSKKNIIHYKIS